MAPETDRGLAFQKPTVIEERRALLLRNDDYWPPSVEARDMVLFSVDKACLVWKQFPDEHSRSSTIDHEVLNDISLRPPILVAGRIKHGRPRTNII